MTVNITALKFCSINKQIIVFTVLKYSKTSKLATKKFEFSLQFNDMAEVKKTGYNFTLGTASINAFKIMIYYTDKILVSQVETSPLF